jgi:anti-anti-sigma factor
MWVIAGQGRSAGQGRRVPSIRQGGSIAFVPLDFGSIVSRLAKESRRGEPFVHRHGGIPPPRRLFGTRLLPKRLSPQPLSSRHRPTTLDRRSHMTAFRDTYPSEPAGHPRSRYVVDCGGARLYVHARSASTVLRVDGEIDMANAGLVAQAIRGFARLKAPLILDLSQLDFLGIAGFRLLIVLNHEHQQARLPCGIVNGDSLRRVTRVLPDHGLPIVESETEALWLIDEATRTRRDFPTGMARQREPQRDGWQE